MTVKNKTFGKLFCAVSIFLLLQKNPAFEKIIKERLEEYKTDFKRIRCPHCRWQPKASSRWFCSDCDFPEYFYNGCLTAWNTFATKGKCPGCLHQWRWTSCLSCGEWALHDDWYQENLKI